MTNDDKKPTPSRPTDTRLAELWGVSRRTICNWRKAGVDPLFYGSVISYLECRPRFDFDTWEKAKRNAPKVRVYFEKWLDEYDEIYGDEEDC